MNSQRITLEEASLVLGRSPNRIRNLMKRDYLKGTHNYPVGRAYPALEGNGKSLRYDCYKSMIMEYLHLDKWPGDEEEK